jgi:PiT family inorganic phosphate transporter
VGPLLVGAAVADTIGGIVSVAPSAATAVIGSGLAAAVAWNLLTWWLGLPSSYGHALVGGLVGAALVEGGLHAVTGAGSRAGTRWGCTARSSGWRFRRCSAGWPRCW